MSRQILDTKTFAHLVKLTGEEISNNITIRKYYTCEAHKDSDRTVDFVITTNTVDRYGDIIEPDGVDVKHYMKNPVVLFAHDYSRPPLGKALEIKRNDKGLVARTQFMDNDTDPTGFADMIYKMILKGYINATSIGFVPIRYKEIKHKNTSDDEDEYVFNAWGMKFTAIDLIEYSIVPVPANPEALVAAKSAGIDVNPIREYLSDHLNKWSECENLKHMPRKMFAKALEALNESSKSFISFSNPELKEKLKMAKTLAMNNTLEKITNGEIVKTDVKGLEDMRKAASFEIAATKDAEGNMVAGLPETIKKFKEEVRKETTKGAISYRRAHQNGTPKADENADWDGPSEIASAEIDDLFVMCAWVEDKPMEDLTKNDFKLPHHRADSNHTLVWKGVAAAMAALMGARGGVDIPEEDKEAVYRHLARHYREFDKEPPEFALVADNAIAKGTHMMNEDGIVVPVSEQEGDVDVDKSVVEVDGVSETPVADHKDVSDEAPDKDTPEDAAEYKGKESTLEWYFYAHLRGASKEFDGLARSILERVEECKRSMSSVSYDYSICNAEFDEDSTMSILLVGEDIKDMVFDLIELKNENEEHCKKVHMKYAIFDGNIDRVFDEYTKSINYLKKVEIKKEEPPKPQISKKELYETIAKTVVEVINRKKGKI